MSSQAIFVANGDIPHDDTAGYSVLQTADVTLTAGQFQGFTSIISGTGTGGVIFGATAGTYDLQGKSTEAFNLVAQSNAGTTLIGNDANGDSLTSSGTGADTLQAGNGAGDILNAGGGADTLIAGNGPGDQLNGGADADRFELSTSGSATVTGGTGTNTVVFSAVEANYGFSDAIANGVLTTTVTNKTNGAVDTLINVQNVQFADASVTPLALIGGPSGLLSDPTVKAAVASVLTNGSISYQGMLTVFQDVAAHGTVTSSELSSLQTLASLLNAPGGIAVTPYVQDITDAIIDGNSADAPGNLFAGSSAAQLNGLIGEWFLGTDLPSLAGFSGIAYKNDANTLYGPSGTPLYTDANQGELGDCYLIGSIGECAMMDPKAIKSMFTYNGNGVYAVRFFVNGQPDYVTVNTQLPYFTNGSVWANGSALAFANGAPKWAELIEKAFVELNAQPGVTGETAGNAYADIAGGYAQPVSLITGKSITDYYYANYTSEAAWSSALLSTMASAFDAGEEVLVGTGPVVSDRTRFVTAHMFEVIGYNSTTQLFTLHNPWGSDTSGTTPAITFTASIADLYNNSCEVFVASGQALANEAPTITGTVAGQTTTLEAPLSPFSKVTIGDPKSGATDTLTITFSGAGGTLSGSGLTAIGSSVYTLTGTALAITGQLDALTFTPNANWPNANGTTTFLLSDLSNDYAAATIDNTTTVIDKDPNALTATAAYVAAHIDGINADANVTSITVTDPSNPIVLTASQYASDKATVAKIVGAHAIEVTGVTGQSFTGEEIDYNGGSQITRMLFTGISGASYSSSEYDFVGGVFAGSKVTVTNVPAGAGYSSYELDFDQASAYAGDRIFLTAGKSYTGGEEDFDASGKLSRVVLTGVQNQAYSSLELDYQGGVIAGYKVFYTGVTGQSYTAEEIDVSAAGQLEKVVLQGMSSTPYSSFEVDYTNGAQTRAVLGYTNVTSHNYYADQIVTNGSWVSQQEIFDLNSGGHALDALVGGQTLTSLGEDTMTGSGATTFVLNPIYGADTITNFVAGDTVSLSAQEYAHLGSALQGATSSGGNATLHFSDGDTLTFDNLTPTRLVGMISHFTSHG